MEIELTLAALLITSRISSPAIASTVGLDEKSEEFEIYESDCCGFTIMYPRGWFVDDSLSLEYYKEQDEQTPWTADPDVEFEAPVLAIKGESEEPQSPGRCNRTVRSK